MAEEGGPLEHRERLRRRRRERLLALLPRIFAAQPRDSAVALLLEALAGQLAALDEATERVLRDRWLALAGGEPRFEAGRHPLERMGALLELEREPWEEEEAFRRRLRQTAPVFVQGSTTTRSVLTVATAALDTELCQRLVRLPESDPGRQDTTQGLGMRPGTVARCPGCAKPGAGRCIYEGDKRPNNPIQARLLLTDNPPTPRTLRVSSLVQGTTFQVRSPSLVTDRPELTLRAIKAVRYPSLRNVAGREVMVFAGDLAPGDVLTLVPRRSEEEVRSFDGHKPEGPALQWRTAPQGSALLENAQGLKDVSAKVLFLRAEVFGTARFARDAQDPGGARFTLMGRALLTPRIDIGESTWQYRSYTQQDFDALSTRDLLAERNGAPAGTVESTEPELELTLKWWTRPPATFRVRVPEMPAVRVEDRPRVQALAQRMVTAVRAAGVRTSVDFPEPPRLETHPLDERPFAAKLTTSHQEQELAQESLGVRVTGSFQEQQPQQETKVSIQGIFDVTRLDWTHLA